MEAIITFLQALLVGWIFWTCASGFVRRRR